MKNKLTQMELEKLEFMHLERIRYHFLDNLDEILKGLHSRLEIINDWYKQFMSTKNNVASDLEMGAERIFHYIFSQGMKHPNSSPIGADLMYETFDAFVHIDIKTISDSNWNDYKGKIAIQPNKRHIHFQSMDCRLIYLLFILKLLKKKEIRITNQL